MNKIKILIRIDDVCPTMNWQTFDRVMGFLDKYGVKALLGVIPDCQDPTLAIDEPRKDFWEFVRVLQDNGHTIAMHGYQHTFVTKADGIVTRNKISEFAGLSYDEQYNRIKRGKQILLQNGIKTDVFFAPAHSYDDNTLRALEANGFKYVSDGLSSLPYIRKGVTCLPCRAGGIPAIKGRGYYTAVIHPHEWGMLGKVNAWEALQQLILRYKDNIVSFDQYNDRKPSCAIIQEVQEQLFYVARNKIYPLLRNAVKK